jgi:hypothetical protein
VVIAPTWTRPSPTMLFRSSLVLVFAAHASEYYFFPDPATCGGQHPFGLLPHSPVRVTPFPPPRAQALVESVMTNVSAERMYDNLAEFTAFKTRHSPTKVRVSGERRTERADAGLFVDWTPEPTLVDGADQRGGCTRWMTFWPRA